MHPASPLSRSTAVRTGLIFMLTLVLSACGTAPPKPVTARPQPQAIPDATLPPVLAPGMTPRQRIIEIAEQEWRRWGSQTVQVGANGHGCISASALPSPPEYLAAQSAALAYPEKDAPLLAEITPCWRFADGTGMEATALGCELALRYWHLLGREPDCAEISTPRWAWSAAFISWVMRRAGLTTEQFLVSAAHNMYVADARDGVLPASAFSVEAYPALPTAGDMICSARDATGDTTHVAQIVSGHTPMHCDIVIAVDLQQHIVKAIGGNIQQAVSLSTITWGAPALPVRSTANVIDAPEVDDELGNADMPWLLVMRNRLQ